MIMKIAIASDHRGRAAKDKVALFLSELGHESLDMGTNSAKSCDYPDTAYPAAKSVATGQTDRGILICGSGIGMSICGNKVAGIRAALCHDELTAELSRRHNNANVLCLSSDAIGEELMRRIVSTWLKTNFEPTGRHARRVEKIGCIEKDQDPVSLDKKTAG